MNVSHTKRNIVLGILFFLPVAFLLMLYPAKHNYEPLNIVHEGVADIQEFNSYGTDTLRLKDHITVLGFLGTDPLKRAVVASNLKELVYEKFKGFKKFQVIIVVPEDVQEDIEVLTKKITTYEEMKFWHFVYGKPEAISALYSSLRSNEPIRGDLSTDEVFIIDKDLNQRGRIDGRDKKEIKSNAPEYTLYAYNTIAIGDIKNKMSEDMRVLFTEYRQRRKGRFDDSNTRRAQDLKKINE